MALDRSERVSLMDPLLMSEGSPNRAELTDLAVELAASAAGFRRSLPEGITNALANLIRSMNCYYSNLIEGHDTHPIDIERALKNDYSGDSRKRDLQLEAKAHIEVQKWIDEGGLLKKAVSVDGICEIHKRFGDQLPDELLKTKDVESGKTEKVVPGKLREHDVKVGNLVAISAGAVPRFLKKLEETYSRLGKAETILAVAAAHHRLLWIHPFLDGNGRVARLMSYAMLLETLDSGGLWSIARGLARNVSAYKAHLQECDLPRRNDLDGRGNLSEEALVSFTRFFLETCIDQVRFMENLVRPQELRNRVLYWAGEEIRAGRLPTQSSLILEAILYRGELPRNEVADILGVGDRHARRIVSLLAEREVISSDIPRGPIKLTFSARLASRWMPGLFPEN